MAKTAIEIMSSNNVKPFFIRENMKLDLLLYIVFIKIVVLVKGFDACLYRAVNFITQELIKLLK
ncbi:hypothetical protein ACBO_25140 [Acinetobacter bouvetii]|nr:hypothetical protein ACBO_25140 [Acinetobacter bouvetii]